MSASTRNHCGFRIEIKPTSKLGKRLGMISRVMNHRNDNKCGSLKEKVLIASQKLGVVTGVWTVRKSGVLSFKGNSTNHGTIEYVYGKLAIGYDLDKPGHQRNYTFGVTRKLMSEYIELMFPYLDLMHSILKK